MSRATVTMTHLLGGLACLALVAGAGCDIRSYYIQFDGGTESGDGGGLGDGGGGQTDTGTVTQQDGGDGGTTTTDAGVCIPSGSEVCDGVDNDCNDIVDDVDPARLDHDPNNCGACGTACVDDTLKVRGSCIGAQCTNWACSSGLYGDANNDLSLYPDGDGCECELTNGGQEICDDVDNNCNGLTDEIFDKTMSPNCGECDNACQFPNALFDCVECTCGTDPDCRGCAGGAATGRKCTMGACVANPSPSTNALFKDLNGDSDDGCEYYCVMPSGQQGPSITETCDNFDNDCDGCVDGQRTGFDANGDPICGPHPALTGDPCGTDEGECVAGVTTCQAGVEICAGETPPVGEVCDGKDNDCDTVPDNGFDRLNDVRFCLGAGLDPSGFCQPCSLPNAVPYCDGGVCRVKSCLPGWVHLDGIDANGCERACTPTNGGVEKCDGIDNDCDCNSDDTGNPDGTICGPGDIGVDEGFDLTTDVKNCGDCGNDCANLAQHPESRNASVTCDGTCHRTCLDNYYDIDDDFDGVGPITGCEYYCVETADPTEICDNKDNDCNGEIDDGFNKQTDPDNCGFCGNICSYLNADGRCSGGECYFDPADCHAGWVDLDGIPGCEYECTKTDPTTEVCDGLDNDCNGLTDDLFPDKGTSCTAGQGICVQTGTYICDPGDNTQICCGTGDLNGTGTCHDPFEGWQEEECNSLDDDCDGEIDNDVASTQTDPDNCGECGVRCSVVYQTWHASWTCETGTCVFDQCLPGWWNNEGPTPGDCEYQCTKTIPETEVCDAKDNDCDGDIDMDDPGLEWPVSNFCDTDGECALGDTNVPPDDPRAVVHWGGGVPHPVCRSVNGVTDWYCNYRDTVDLTAPNVISIIELRCDGLDNNCSGADDERWSDLGTTCKEDGTYDTTAKVGACAGSGSLVCKTADPIPPNLPPSEGLTCDVTTPGLAPTPEVCDDEDNDCDGRTDELWDSLCGAGLDCTACTGGICAGVRDRVVRLQRSDSARYPGGIDTFVYEFEAARTDATNLVPGLLQTRACSKVDVGDAPVYPWGNLNIHEARAACMAAGMRLCTYEEWTAACEGSCDVYEEATCWKTVRTGAPGSGTVVNAGTGASQFYFDGAGFVASDLGKSVRITSGPAGFYEIVKVVSPSRVKCMGTVADQPSLDYAVMGPSAYPYGLDYETLTCNGNDYPGPPPDDDEPVPTGSLAACVTPMPAQIYDLSGNLKEWTEHYQGDLPDGRAIYTMRGGSYSDSEPGLACTFLDTVAAEDFSFPTAGFRCCQPTPPCAVPPCTPPTPGLGLCPTADICSCPGGEVGPCVDATCPADTFCDAPVDPLDQRHCAGYVNFADDPLNCGRCGVTCVAGCTNGVCD